MKQFIAVIVLAVVASVCGAQQKTVKPALSQQVEGVNPACPKGEYLSIDGRCLHDRTGESSPSGDGCNTNTCFDPACRWTSTTAMTCLHGDDPAAGPFGLPSDSHVVHPVETVPFGLVTGGGYPKPSADQVESILHGVGKYFLVRLEKSKFSPADQATISVMVRSAMEDYKREAAKDGAK